MASPPSSQTEGFSLNPRDLVSFVADMKRKRKVGVGLSLWSVSEMVSSQREVAYSALELLRGKGHHLGDRTSIAWLRVYGEG